MELTTGRNKVEPTLLESQRHYQAVLRTSIDGYWTTDMQGRFLEVNDAYCKLIGYSRAELLRMSISDVEAVESAEDTARHITKLMRDGADRFLTRHRRKNGQTIDIEVSSVYMPERGGRLVVFLRDVTERVRMEAERAEMLERARQAQMLAEQANRTKDIFLATLSHELRTPLTTILFWAQMIRTGRVGPEKMLRAGEAIERSARTQAQLIDDLLDISKIAKGKLSVKKVDLDPMSPLLAAVELVRPQAQGKQIRLELDSASAVGLVHGDPIRLQQVFCNLLTNAVKFTAAGGEVAVRLDRAERDDRGRAGPFVRVRVKDTGRGIRPDMRERIFEAFTQQDGSTTRAEGGLGLGLAIVKGFVEIHQGSVTVSSEGEGKGSTFTVLLPVVSPQWTASPPPLGR